MILAIDVGNIRTTIALFDREGALSFQSELETDAKMTDDRCAIDLMGVFHLYQAELGRVDGAILSSVVPPITGTYVRTLRRLTGRPPLVVGPGLKTGLNIKAEIHNQLGSDIVASAVAVSALYPTPAIVINSRTAVTFSYMSANTFEGCAIMPGVDIALEALSQNGAQLPQISMAQVDTRFWRPFSLTMIGACPIKASFLVNLSSFIWSVVSSDCRKLTSASRFKAIRLKSQLSIA